MIPRSKPQAILANVTRHATRQWKKHRGSDPMPEMFLVGVPGYYWRTMGDPNANDRGIYDDAIFVVSPTMFAAFNANADPSPRYRAGIATLLPGVHPFRPGNHGISRPGGGYPAFRPATPGERLPVKRDGESRVPSARPGVAVNIHRGGLNTTSSAGCQTIPPAQWNEFYTVVRAEMRRHGQSRFEYILLNPGAIA